MVYDPTFFVGAAFLVFVALLYKPVAKLLSAGLDQRAQLIQDELETAQKLKDEAQALLATYQRNQRKAMDEVEEILQHARSEVDLITQQARESMEAELNKRTDLVMQKIAQTEARVLEDVRDNLVDIVGDAARIVISQNLKDSSQEKLVTDAISDISSKYHH